MILFIITSSESARADAVAIAYCSYTKITAVGRGRNVGEAREVAVKLCIADGGKPLCCSTIIAAVSRERPCVALAKSPDGEIGSGSGVDKEEAKGAALDDCGENCSIAEAICVR
jgi:hypothetical protein